ncbi:MAG: asparaginase [Actinomycetes bacterium]
MTSSEGYVPLAAVERSGFDEGLHFGRLVGLAADGAVAFAFGDVDAPMHPRSANKLMQAAGMRSLGLILDGELLALSAASHEGEAQHVDGVRSILASAGLNETSLQTTPALPSDAEARRAVLRADGLARPIFHGCSGKHAAMLATCVHAGWETETYLDPEHPLQALLKDTVEGVIGEHVVHIAVDGCGAPAYSMRLHALARAFWSAVVADRGSLLRDVADAMRAHPEFVGGERSEVTGLMRAVPGLLVQDGAEGVYAAALPDGRAVAVKVADGGFRAGQVALVAALRVLGAASEPGVDAEALDRLGTVPVLGHGEPVGRIRPLVP